MTITAFGGTNILRLASNLILTRILMPEAFGLMAVVQVFLSAMEMFSDTGISDSIVQNKRGDDPDFLNTAWTMQIVRGVLIWLLCCAISYPAALLYDEPLLGLILPIAGLAPLIQGFTTTNVGTANRYLLLGRVTAIELVAQLLGIIVMIIFAYIYVSVWALVIGSVVTMALKVIGQNILMPGIRNKVFFEKAAFWDMFNYGKYIFLSTAVTFVTLQGDKAILSGYVSLAELGVYNIAYLLGALPFLLCTAINKKVLFPLYRLKPVHESLENRRNVLKLRRLIVAGSLAICVLLGFSGLWLIDVMYTPEYALAGPVVVLLSLSMVPRILQLNYGQVVVAAGDSRSLFWVNFLTAVIQTALILVGVKWFGMFGVIIALGLAPIFTYPPRAYCANLYKGWDPKGDILLGGASLALTGLACWLHWDAVSRLF